MSSISDGRLMDQRNTCKLGGSYLPRLTVSIKSRISRSNSELGSKSRVAADLLAAFPSPSVLSDHVNRKLCSEAGLLTLLTVD